MLELRFIRENLDLVREKTIRRGLDPALIDAFARTDSRRRDLLAEVENLKNRRNTVSREIARLKKEGEHEKAEPLIVEMREVSARIKELDAELATVQEELDRIVLSIPNLCDDSVPVGRDDSDNVEIRHWGTPPEFPFTPKPHWEIGEQLEILDFETSAKLAGARFALLKGFASRLERALINFFLDQARAAGYEEYQPPLLVNAATARGTGQLPDKEGQMYHIEKDDLYLIPTAEVPLTNIYRDAIVPEAQLPIKMVGYTPCFRREAGSYGAHVRGLNRVHQFDKVEIVQIAHPDHSYEVLESMVAYVAALLDKLELPYRIVRLCGGDLGFTAALTYDFEVWSAAQRRWLEVSSVSNFETYQSNRMKLRFRGKDKKPRLAHTLNGSALALARIVAALLENNQSAEGIRIPKVLVPYTGFAHISA